MSHTDKDRPYWVQTNDPTLPRHANHGHYLFGRTRTRFHLVRDNHGRPVYHDVEKIRYIPRGNRILPERHWFTRPQYLPDNIRSQYFIAENVTIRKPLYEVREIVFTDHCTIDEPNMPRSHKYDQPCGYDLDWWVYSPYKPRGGTVEDRRLVHSGQRRTIANSLRNYVKEVNGADDWSDLDDSHLPDHTRRHTIIWW